MYVQMHKPAVQGHGFGVPHEEQTPNGSFQKSRAVIHPAKGSCYKDAPGNDPQFVETAMYSSYKYKDQP